MWASMKSVRASASKRGAAVGSGRGRVSTEASATTSMLVWFRRMPKLSTRVPQ